MDHDEQLDAESVITILRSDLERERWQNVLLRAQVLKLKAEAEESRTTPEQPVG